MAGTTNRGNKPSEEDLRAARSIETYYFGLLCLYALLGFYGTLWISDEFDAERTLFYAFFAVPLALYVGVRRVRQAHWREDRPESYWLCVAAVLLAFSWGNFLLLNAISAQEEALVNVTLNQGTYAMTHQRGGFDWLYRPRW